MFYDNTLGQVAVGIGDGELQCSLALVLHHLETRGFGRRRPPDRSLGVLCIVGEGGPMVAVNLTCRGDALAWVGVIIEVAGPVVVGVDGIALYPVAFFHALQ